ncbi:MAG: helix-turn-helix domain-containing protein [Candidatus Sulfotelmatobacter sp.]
MGEFGNKFRKAREKKELSLDDVSNVTKIGSRMLQAIEEERFDQLPGGVFNKGFIRAYAKHLGLNDQDAVTEYLACLRQAQIDAHEVWEPQPTGQIRAGATERPRLIAPNKEQPNKQAPNKMAAKTQLPSEVGELPELHLPRAEDVRPRRKEFIRQSESVIPWRLLAVAAVVIVLGVVLWTRRSHRTNAAAASTAPVQTAESAPIAAPTPAVNKTPAAALPAGTVAVVHSSASNPQPSQHSASAAATHPAAPAPATPPAPAAPGNGDARNSSTAQTLPKSNPAPSEKAAAPLTLVIRASETSWISVLADGQTVSQETLIAPAHTSVRANREIIAKIGNAAGVTFLFNGQEIAAAGAEAEVKTFVFDSNGMRIAPAIPPPAQ